MGKEKQSESEPLMARLYGNELATRGLTCAILAALPQLWNAERLMDRYSARWEEIKALFEEKLGVRLGDKRTARVHVEQVLALDAKIRGEGGKNSERGTRNAE